MIKSGAHLEQYRSLVEMLAREGNTQSAIEAILNTPKFKPLANRDLITAMMVYALAAATVGDTGNVQATMYSSQILERTHVVSGILGQEIPDRLDHLLAEIK